MCQPPGGLGHLGHLPPSCAVLRATNNFTNINTNTRDRACMLTLMSSNVNIDLFAWIFRLFWNLESLAKIVIPGCYLCNEDNPDLFTQKSLNRAVRCTFFLQVIDSAVLPRSSARPTFCVFGNICGGCSVDGGGGGPEIGGARFPGRPDNGRRLSAF